LGVLGGRGPPPGAGWGQRGGATLTRLAPLGTLSRDAGEGK
jgi:hypothetical protein